MADATGAEGRTGGRALLAVLALVGVVQLLLSYRTALGDGGADILDNLLWPYLAISSVAYGSGRLRTSRTKLGLCASGAVLAGVSFVVEPAPEKLLVASALVVTGVFYALEEFADGETATFTSP